MKVLLFIFGLSGCAHIMHATDRLPDNTAGICPWTGTAPENISELSYTALGYYEHKGRQQLHDAAKGCWEDHLAKFQQESEAMACIVFSLENGRSFDFKINSGSRFPLPNEVKACLDAKLPKAMTDIPNKVPLIEFKQSIALRIRER